MSAPSKISKADCRRLALEAIGEWLFQMPMNKVGQINLGEAASLADALAEIIYNAQDNEGSKVF